MLRADRDADNLAKTADAIGSAAATAVVDLAAPECGDRIVEAALAHMCGIDAVISNSGIIMGGALLDLGLAEVDTIFAINTRSTFLIVKSDILLLQDIPDL